MNTETLVEILKECLAFVQSDIGISVPMLAQQAMNKMDPDETAPKAVSWAANLQMRQLARQVLRKEYEPENEDDRQIELFEKLQERYPVTETIGKVYKPLHLLTDSQLMENENRLRQAGDALLEHADALASYRNNREDMAAHMGQ